MTLPTDREKLNAAITATSLRLVDFRALLVLQMLDDDSWAEPSAVVRELSNRLGLTPAQAAASLARLTEAGAVG